MKEKIDKLMCFIIPILIIGIAFRLLSFSLVCAVLLLRLVTLDKHSAGIFLLMFGGLLAGCVRLEFPTLPIYGLPLIIIGAWLLRDLFADISQEKTSIGAMLIVLLYFFLSYILSSNVGERFAYNKIVGMIQHGAFMFVGYYALIHSRKVHSEGLCQTLFIATILYLTHNMNFFSIGPSNFFDYEWHRQATEMFHENDELVDFFIGYQYVGMSALYGLSFYLSQVNIKSKKTIYYILIAVQLILYAGARQAVFGLAVILALRYAIFNYKNIINNAQITQKFRNILIVSVLSYVLLQVLQLLGLEYISNTFQEGDSGREELGLYAWGLFLQYPMFGSGIGGFHHHIHMLYPHNMILEILCECGIVGSMILCLIVYRHLKSQKMEILYRTNNNTFVFLIMAALVVRVLVSADLCNSIELFSAVFACSSTAVNKKFWNNYV